MLTVLCDSCGRPISDADYWRFASGTYCRGCAGHVAASEERLARLTDPFMAWLYGERQTPPDAPTCNCPSAGGTGACPHAEWCAALTFSLRQAQHTPLCQFSDEEIRDEYIAETEGRRFEYLRAIGVMWT